MQFTFQMYRKEEREKLEKYCKAIIFVEVEMSSSKETTVSFSVSSTLHVK